MLALFKKIIEIANYKIQLDIGSDGNLDLNVQLTKIKFNELCEELYAKTSKLIDDTLRMANLKTDDIDHVVNNLEKLFHSDRKYLP